MVFHSPTQDEGGGDNNNNNTSKPQEQPTMKVGGGGGVEDNINVDLSSVPVKVDNILFDGLCRTRRDFVENSISDIFLTNNFEELILSVGQAQQKLRNLGIFKEVGTLVDTAKGADVTPDSYVITFLVKESKRVNGGVSGMVGANEGTAQLGISFPNVLGRGETLSFNHSYSSSKGKRSEINFSKPYPYIGSKIYTSIYACRSPNPFSSINTSAIGTDVKYEFKLRQHDICSVQWLGVWRHLSALNSEASYPIREYFGNSIKSALRLIYTSDKRDQPIFPQFGTLRRITLEGAGLFGDAKFLKAETDFQYNFPLFRNGTVFQACLRGGLFQNLSNSPISYEINDLFFLGGPASLRGFAMRGVGPRCQQNSLGGKVVWASAFHLYAPLPFVNSRFPIAENLRCHAFVNVGSIGNTAYECCDIKNVRGSSGIGLAYRFGQLARLELNYCYPFKFDKKDRLVNGFQFGVGLEFL